MNKIKKAFYSIIDKVDAVKDKINSKLLQLMIMSSAVMAPMPVHAAANVTVKTDVDINAAMNGVVSWMITAVQFVGVILLVWGVAMLSLSIKNDEPESKQRAIMQIVAGGFAVGIITILKAVGVIA